MIPSILVIPDYTIDFGVKGNLFSLLMPFFISAAGFFIVLSLAAYCLPHKGHISVAAIALMNVYPVLVPPYMSVLRSLVAVSAIFYTFRLVEMIQISRRVKERYAYAFIMYLNILIILLSGQRMPVRLGLSQARLRSGCCMQSSTLIPGTRTFALIQSGQLWQPFPVPYTMYLYSMGVIGYWVISAHSHYPSTFTLVQPPSNYHRINSSLLKTLPTPTPLYHPYSLYYSLILHHLIYSL